VYDCEESNPSVLAELEMAGVQKKTERGFGISAKSRSVSSGSAHSRGRSCFVEYDVIFDQKIHSVTFGVLDKTADSANKSSNTLTRFGWSGSDGVPSSCGSGSIHNRHEWNKMQLRARRARWLPGVTQRSAEDSLSALARLSTKGFSGTGK